MIILSSGTLTLLMLLLEMGIGAATISVAVKELSLLDEIALEEKLKEVEEMRLKEKERRAAHNVEFEGTR